MDDAFAAPKQRMMAIALSSRGSAFKVRLDLFQRLAFCFRQKERSGYEVHNATRREYEEHGSVAVFADGW